MSKPVFLAMYKGKGDWKSWLVKKFSRSIYSHCEILIGEHCYSSTVKDNGVRKDIFIYNEHDWDLFEIPWAKAKKIEEHYLKTQNNGYGWFDLFSGYIFRSPVDHKGDFCSEWCAEALGISISTRLSPQDLLDICMDRGCKQLEVS